MGIASQTLPFTSCSETPSLVEPSCTSSRSTRPTGSSPGADRALRGAGGQYVLSPKPHGSAGCGRQAAGDREHRAARRVGDPRGGEPASRLHRRHPHLWWRLLRYGANRMGPGDPAGAAVRHRASPEAVCRREPAVACRMWEGRRLVLTRYELQPPTGPPPRVTPSVRLRPRVPAAVTTTARVPGRRTIQPRDTSSAHSAAPSAPPR